MKPRRPYLLRALHEWITDSGETPHIVVDAAAEGVTVPRQYVKDGKIVLNVSFSATQMLKLGNEFVSFEARFGGRISRCRCRCARYWAFTRARRARA